MNYLNWGVQVNYSSLQNENNIFETLFKKRKDDSLEGEMNINFLEDQAILDYLLIDQYCFYYQQNLKNTYLLYRSDLASCAMGWGL